MSSLQNVINTDFYEWYDYYSFVFGLTRLSDDSDEVDGPAAEPDSLKACDISWDLSFMK